MISISGGVCPHHPHEDYLACAFTSQFLLFPEVIQPFGWHVIEYSNQGSAVGRGNMWPCRPANSTSTARAIRRPRQRIGPQKI